MKTEQKKPASIVDAAAKTPAKPASAEKPTKRSLIGDGTKGNVSPLKGNPDPTLYKNNGPGPH